MTITRIRLPVHQYSPPKSSEITSNLKTMFKSAVMGTFIGSIPGLGCDVAAFITYGEAKRSSKHPEKFGTGILENLLDDSTLVRTYNFVSGEL